MICLGKNFHSILKDWEWVKESTKGAVEEIEATKVPLAILPLNSQNVEGKRKATSRLEQSLMKQFETLGKQSSYEIEKKKGNSPSVFENFTRVIADKFDVFFIKSIADSIGAHNSQKRSKEGTRPAFIHKGYACRSSSNRNNFFSSSISISLSV